MIEMGKHRGEETKKKGGNQLFKLKWLCETSKLQLLKREFIKRVIDSVFRKKFRSDLISDSIRALLDDSTLDCGS